ncbi:hypothetical protein OQA88_1437 [Cercophora sp. LCS_1]
MRLIDCETYELVEVSEPTEPYAILSHTWGHDELSFREYLDPAERRYSATFRTKIEPFCEVALADGIRFAWADTCCIDKSSSAELSEAINSMWTWYKNAEVCYAYLSDVPGDVKTHDPKSAFARSRWFTRGWTLQELVAPRRLEFFAEDWALIGDKATLLDELEAITGINREALAGQDLADFSVARRMSWASSRQTTRPEDIAYCLMGIFDVNMPMLYGEGSKAFIRLQEEIMRNTEDQSLFAWKATPESAKQFPYRGLLSSSPAEFAGCGNIKPYPVFTAVSTPVASTSRGIPLTGKVLPEWSTNQPLKIGKGKIKLNCFDQEQGQSRAIMIEVTGVGGDRYLRSSPHTDFSFPEVLKAMVDEDTTTVWLPKSVHKATAEAMPNSTRQHEFYVVLPGDPWDLKLWYRASGRFINIPPPSEGPYGSPRLIPSAAWNVGIASLLFKDEYIQASFQVHIWVWPFGLGETIKVQLHAEVTDFANGLDLKAHKPTDWGHERIVRGDWASGKSRPSLPPTQRLTLKRRGGEQSSVDIKLELRTFQGLDVFCLVVQ